MDNLTTIISVGQNIAQAISNLAQTYLNVNGNNSVTGITAATLVSTKPGRMCMCSVIAADGVLADAGLIYDANSTLDLSRPIFNIPPTPGDFFVNFPVAYGILVVPGPGMTVSVSYS
jgi:hypothetical protein